VCECSKGILMVDQVAKMKHNAIIGNIGHFDNEIDMAGIQKFPGINRINIKPQVDKWSVQTLTHCHHLTTHHHSLVSSVWSSTLATLLCLLVT
jgi:S-adenosylhomocysteine hydrolase